MAQDYPVNTSISIDATVEKVWEALTTPKLVKQYMFGADVTSNWQKDKPIVFSGEWQGKRYEDKGIIKTIDKNEKLEYTHWSSLSGVPDNEENQHVVTIQLTNANGSTILHLKQTNNKTKEAHDHSKQMWDTALDALKRLVEQA